jgi:hypothetical protein
MSTDNGDQEKETRKAESDGRSPSLFSYSASLAAEQVYAACCSLSAHLAIIRMPLGSPSHIHAATLSIAFAFFHFCSVVHLSIVASS